MSQDSTVICECSVWAVVDRGAVLSAHWVADIPMFIIVNSECFNIDPV